MFGENPKRGVETNLNDELYIQEIFLTLQGEGPYVGQPSVFLRLGGCNLACKFCDTEFESFQKMSLEQILDQIQLVSTNTNSYQKLVVITGGEPFRQPIAKLCNKLLDQGFKIQIETNGTLYQEIPKEVEVICSPKNSGRGYKPIREDLLRIVSGLKFIVSANNVLYNKVTEVGQKKYNIPVFVQPMDEHDESLNKKNLIYATNLALRYGYRLSVQLHKLIGIQ